MHEKYFPADDFSLKAKDCQESQKLLVSSLALVFIHAGSEKITITFVSVWLLLPPSTNACFKQEMSLTCQLFRNLSSRCKLPFHFQLYLESANLLEELDQFLPEELRPADDDSSRDSDVWMQAEEIPV